MLRNYQVGGSRRSWSRMPEVAGGEDTGDGSQIFSRNAQDDSPRCGLAPQRKSAFAVVPLSSGCWSVRDTLRCKHTQGVRKVETETTPR